MGEERPFAVTRRGSNKAADDNEIAIIANHSEENERCFRGTHKCYSLLMVYLLTKSPSTVLPQGLKFDIEAHDSKGISKDGTPSLHLFASASVPANRNIQPPTESDTKWDNQFDSLVAGFDSHKRTFCHTGTHGEFQDQRTLE
jgi:hypothetical protein